MLPKKTKTVKTTRYLEVHPWSIVENGFHPLRSRASESIFSLANEFMGTRGFFEEGYSGDTMVGCYFNAVFDEHPIIYANKFKGFSDRTHFMVSAVNWLHTRLTLDGETLDLHVSKVGEFVRALDLRAGILTRSLVWETGRGRRVKVCFTRFLSMVEPGLGAQRIEIEAQNFSGKISVSLALDFSPVQHSEGRCLWNGRCRENTPDGCAIVGETTQSGHKILSMMKVQSSVNPATSRALDAGADDRIAGIVQNYDLRRGVGLCIDRLVVHRVERRREVSAEKFLKAERKSASRILATTFDRERERHAGYWAGYWKDFDIRIEGDPAYEQGTRYCLFQLHSTYHGVDSGLNIGAKGLTGEQYGGLAFWDTETYCLPFYLFTDPAAARNLLLFRYNTLEQAKERAIQVGCVGARYPMTTIDGTEACVVWNHGDLEIHVPAAVAYGVWHYVRVTGDEDFLFRYGVEILVEISRFYASHGNWSPETGEFGLWGVMGADEFHMMVHNNAYTNTMAKKTFEWTLDSIKKMQAAEPQQWSKLSKKLKLSDSEPLQWRKMAKKMRLQNSAANGLIEQHDGYFDLPVADPELLGAGKMSICKTQPYLSRSRYNWIKQPDVLLLPLFFGRDYTMEEKRVNFEFYEPKCAHESSLSPGVHSILAAELGLQGKAFEYVRYASRLDLDDYNGNTHEGLHMTSMAAAWMSLVYGFGGMRSDGERLSFNPSIPIAWKSFAFRLLYRGTLLEVRVNPGAVVFRRLRGGPVAFEVFGKKVTLAGNDLTVPISAR